jgi:hypothetical protein
VTDVAGKRWVRAIVDAVDLVELAPQVDPPLHRRDDVLLGADLITQAAGVAELGLRGVQRPRDIGELPLGIDEPECAPVQRHDRVDGSPCGLAVGDLLAAGAGVGDGDRADGRGDGGELDGHGRRGQRGGGGTGAVETDRCGGDACRRGLGDQRHGRGGDLRAEHAARRGRGEEGHLEHPEAADDGHLGRGHGRRGRGERPPGHGQRDARGGDASEARDQA